MKPGQWRWLKRLPAFLETPQREPAEHAQRIVALQRNILLPARLLVVVVVFFHLYNSPWLGVVVDTYGVLFETAQATFAACALVMLVVTVLFYVVRRFPPGAVQWVVFASGLADGVFLAGLTTLTGGFDSVLYWVFPALIIINALSIPLATPQIVLNLVLCIFFLGAGLLEASTDPELTLPSFRRPTSKNRISHADVENSRHLITWLNESPDPIRKLIWDGFSPETKTNLAQLTNSVGTNVSVTLAEDLNRIFSPPTRIIPADRPGIEGIESSGNPYILQVAVLLLLTFCCYGMQLLLARQRRTLEERQEFFVRTEQLHSAGRLAAEVAHQIKNPLAIINNAAFTLLRGDKDKPREISQPLEIIREEVAKADRIITQLMGYAQLSEGRVEKLEVVEELNRAIEQVFPAAIPSGIRVHRHFAGEFPPLLMQRRHLSESLVNLLQNAREALGQPDGDPRGEVTIVAECLRDYSVQISVADNGPGIPPDKIERIFEAYYTTKEKGTGLGLSLVKNNVELYGGSVRVESALGRGVKFVLLFPAKALIKFGK
jgi:signal transduction histidine kinase